MKLKVIAIIAALSTTPVQSSNFSIRFAQTKDIPAILALDKEVTDEFFIPTMTAGYPELFAHNRPLLDKLNKEWDEYIATILKEGTSKPNNNTQHVLIAACNKKPDTVVGFCAFIKQKDSLYIQYFIVAQQARNKGIGKALLSNALSTYKDIRSCKIETLARNNESTQAFYEKYGFTKKELCTLDKNMPNGHLKYELNLQKEQ